jgi:hypothetical protein
MDYALATFEDDNLKIQFIFNSKRSPDPGAESGHPGARGRELQNMASTRIFIALVLAAILAQASAFATSQSSLRSAFVSCPLQLGGRSRASAQVGAFSGDSRNSVSRICIFAFLIGTNACCIGSSSNCWLSYEVLGSFPPMPFLFRFPLCHLGSDFGLCSLNEQETCLFPMWCARVALTLDYSAICFPGFVCDFI